MKSATYPALLNSPTAVYSAYGDRFYEAFREWACGSAGPIQPIVFCNLIRIILFLCMLSLRSVFQIFDCILPQRTVQTNRF